jgi:UDP-N-acetylmuramoyl-L-alanyl-D-glutamate--2,6-diaminopimelate ligase
MGERTLRELLHEIPYTLSGDVERSIQSIEIDSRAVRPGSLFVGLRGEHVDGNQFVAQAIAGGASAVVVSNDTTVPSADATTIVHVADTRRALSRIAAAFFGEPSRAMRLLGVTGTNGKTTVVNMLGAICDAARLPCGIIGTVGARFGDRRWTLAHTTPLPPELHGLFVQMRDAGARAVAMEVSSHALALDRVEDVRFSVGAYTNLTRDHLDFHGTFDAYAAAKRHLFDLAERAVLNIGDAHGRAWADEIRGRIPVLTYALEGKADLVPEEVRVHSDGSSFSLDGTAYELRMAGRFNVANAVCAVGIARQLEIDDAISARGLAALERVAGRMERVAAGDVDVVVDYSHTPDSLEHALRALRETTAGSLAVVFGCGGDRDPGKRPQMGAVAERLADRVYVTSDNPRTEDPRSIVEAIVAGMTAPPIAVDINRRSAIERAIGDALTGDVVLIAGKGHETYQIVGDRVLPFDDAAVAREALTLRRTHA